MIAHAPHSPQNVMPRFVGVMHDTTTQHQRVDVVFRRACFSHPTGNGPSPVPQLDSRNNPRDLRPSNCGSGTLVQVAHSADLHPKGIASWPMLHTRPADNSRVWTMFSARWALRSNSSWGPVRFSATTRVGRLHSSTPQTPCLLDAFPSSKRGLRPGSCSGQVSQERPGIGRPPS